jgi:glycosyltransferase involved in cell wall biosynthesis
VLYVEAPLTPLAVRQGRAFLHQLARTLQPPELVQERLWVSRHVVPIPYHAVSRLTSTRAANRLGQRWLAPRVRADLARLGFHAPPILIAGLPHAVDALPGLRWRTLVYHCADDYAHMRGFPHTFPELEAELCRRADLVVTTSQTLCEARRAWNPHTHWLPNGVDFDHFSTPAVPGPELSVLPRPVIGFVGGISQWVDVSLLATLAEARPDWSIVLVGPIGMGIDIAPLRHHANVHLLGPRPYDRLPAYLAGMDVALIPFRQDPVTYHADPIKAYEYLAAGVPVVATDLPALRRLQHVVRLAASPAAFIQQVEAAMHAGRLAGCAERQAEAARHSWSSRFERLAAWLDLDRSRACVS